MNMPGFTAETSLYRSGTCYRRRAGAHGGALPGAGTVVPQAMVCSACSNFVLGSMSCCDVVVTRGPNGVPEISIGACVTRRCGFLGGLVGGLLDLIS